jgi:hypothetical protein
MQPHDMSAIIAMRISHRPMLIGSWFSSVASAGSRASRGGFEARVKKRSADQKLLNGRPPEAYPPPLSSRNVGMIRWRLYIQ